MQLSVSTSPAESNLAAPLLGIDVSGDPPNLAAPVAMGANAALFATLFPHLASVSRAGGPAAAPTATVALPIPGTLPAALTRWIGSTVPCSTVPPAPSNGAGPAAKKPASLRAMMIRPAQS